ncbi:MAG: site-specific integrase [Bryobacteraceae bacterium]|nr:site-specific integrase [Bryobacteraceae bacterium]
MKGSVFKSVAPNGRISWRYQIDAGRDENGKRIRISESGFRLEREAVDALREKIQELKRGGPVGMVGSLKEYLERWLPYHARAKPLAPKTAERYASLAAHATRALGAVKLKDLTTFMLDDLYVKLAETLSAKTVREVHNVIHVALKRAVKTKLIPFNPADGCDLPRLDQKEAVALNPDQLAAYQAAAAGTWVDLLIRLAAAIGARRGELLASRWSDLDWDTNRLRIERSLYQVKGEIGIKPTKTRQVRVVSVPPSLMEYLKLHREAQEKDRALFGPDYRTDLDLIFADPAGNYLLPSSISRAAVRLAKKAGLSGVGLHSLRHTHASTLIRAGVPIPNVSKRLGHRDTYTTAKIYAHAIPDTDQDVAAIWDKLMAEKSERKPGAQNGTNDQAVRDVSSNELVS